MRNVILWVMALLSIAAITTFADEKVHLTEAERARLHRLVFIEKGSEATAHSTDSLNALVDAVILVSSKELPALELSQQQRSQLRFLLPSGMIVHNCQGTQGNYVWPDYVVSLIQLRPSLLAFVKAHAAINESDCCGDTEPKGIDRVLVTTADNLLTAFEELHSREKRAALPPRTYVQYKVSLRYLQEIAAQARQSRSESRKLCFSATTTVELIRFLTEHQCKLAPPLPNEDGAYFTIAAWLTRVLRVHASELEIAKLPSRADQHPASTVNQSVSKSLHSSYRYNGGSSRSRYSYQQSTPTTRTYRYSIPSTRTRTYTRYSIR